MTPFLEFRMWLRRGPGGERALAGVASLLVLALVVWALIPVDRDDRELVGLNSGEDPIASDGSGQPGAGSAEDPSGTAGSATGAGGAGSARAGTGRGAGTGTGTGSGSGGGTPGQSASCSNLKASEVGVTEKEVFIAVSLINLGGEVGNQAFGIRPDLEGMAHAAAAGINAEGGVACRRLRIKTYRVNPLDQNETRRKCLEMAQDKPFAVLDFGGYLTAVSRSCFAENKIPYQGALQITEEEAQRSFPYMFTISASANRQLRSWVFDAGTKARLDPAAGFKKLGLMNDACEPKISEELLRNLNEIGVRREQISVFTLSCGAIAPPNQVAQAMSQHRNDGATHVFFAASAANSQRYVQSADQVQYKPVYMAADFGAVTNATSEKGWGPGFDGTIATTSTRGGELNSGIKHPLIARCQEWFRRANQSPPEKDGDSAFFACSSFRLFQAAATAAGPNPTRATLLPGGLAKVGRFESGTHGDALFDRGGKVTGGDFVRSIQWKQDCTCWKVLDDFRPAR